MSVSFDRGRCLTGPVCPGTHRLRPRRGGLLPCRGDGCCWSCGCRQGGDTPPAGDEGVLPAPVAADFQGAAAGVADEPGRHVPQPVTQGARLGVLEVLDVVEPEQPAPCLQVGGNVRRDGPAAVDPPGLRRKAAQPGGLPRPDAVLDNGVLAVQHVDELGMPAPGNAFQPFPGDIRAGNRVLPAGLLLIGGEVLQVPAGRPDPADDPAQAGRPVPGPAHQAGDLRDVAVVFGVPVLGDAGLPRLGRDLPDVVLVGPGDSPAAGEIELPARDLEAHHVRDEVVAGAGSV